MEKSRGKQNFKKSLEDFSDGTVDKNPPANAGDIGSIPDLRISQRLQSKPVYHSYWACALEHTSHKHQAILLQLLKSAGPRACVPQQEKPPQWEVHVAMKTQCNQISKKKKRL